jgi:hypothetical protein
MLFVYLYRICSVDAHCDDTQEEKTLTSHFLTVCGVPSIYIIPHSQMIKQ